MAFRITPSGDPAKSRLMTFTDLRTGKPLGSVKLPSRTENRSAMKRQAK